MPHSPTTPSKPAITPTAPSSARSAYDHGFRVVVSSSFADIFRGNALNNGLLPLTVSEGFLAEILADIDANNNTKFEVDLEAQTITILSTRHSERFEIDAYKKKCLMNGQDDIDYLVSLAPEINNYELRVTNYESATQAR